MSNKMREALIEALEVGSHLMSAASYARAKAALAEQPVQTLEDQLIAAAHRGATPAEIRSQRVGYVAAESGVDREQVEAILVARGVLAEQPGRAEPCGHVYRLVVDGAVVGTQYVDGRCKAREIFGKPDRDHGGTETVTPVYTAPPAPAVPDDAQLLNAVMDNCWKVEPVNVPTGGDDYSVSWRVVEFHMPNQDVEIARTRSDDPREAIREAIRLMIRRSVRAAMLAAAPGAAS